MKKWMRLLITLSLLFVCFNIYAQELPEMEEDFLPDDPVDEMEYYSTQDRAPAIERQEEEEAPMPQGDDLEWSQDYEEVPENY